MRILGGAPEGCASFGRAAYGGVKGSAWCEAPPKIGGCSRCARPAGTLAAEQYVLAGGAGQNMIASYSAGCGRRNSARRALPGESVGWKGGLGTSGLFAGCRPDLLGVPSRASPLDGRGLDTLQGSSHPPKPSPWGEAGSDEGAIWYPTFPGRKGGLPPVASTEFFSCSVGQPGRPLISHLR